jgi:amidase
MIITDLSAAALSEAIHGRQVSCREVMAAYLDRIDQCNASVNAIVSLREHDELMAEAATCDDELSHGLSRGWMHGMPQAIKDLAETKGLRTTYGSRLLQHWVPDFDCLMVERMKAAGCIVIGKTNVPEFGKGSHTYNDVFGTTLNAYDHTRSAGGSSGGAAVALATHMLPVADGSDYMGSLRNPAAWNNVFGMRPSQGRVPSWPASDAFFDQMGTEGPMGRTVLDVALLLGTQAGYDRRVPLSLSGRLDELSTVATARETLRHDPAGTRVGWLGDLGGHLAMESGILDRCRHGLESLVALGCHVEPAVIGVDLHQVWDAWLVLRHMSVTSSLSMLVDDPDTRQLVKPEVLWELDQGLTLSAADVVLATGTRTTLHTAMVALFDRFDVLAIPSAQVWPFDATLPWPRQIGDRSMDTYHRWMEVTLYATFAGLPAISVPVGMDDRGLPMGMQLIGEPRGDVDLLRLAASYEAAATR